MNILNSEQDILDDIAKKIVIKRQAWKFNQENKDMSYWYKYIVEIKRIIGNFDMTLVLYHVYGKRVSI